MKAPQRGYDMETRTTFGPGHQCELFVLARHEGQAIDSGWTFAVARLDQLADRKGVTPAHLTELGINLVPAEQLKAAAEKVLALA